MEEEKQYGYGKRPLWQWLILYAVIAVVVYGLVYYFVLPKNGKGLNTYTAPNSSYATPTQNVPSPSTQAAVKQVIVKGNEFAFAPSTITVQKDQAVEIVFKNTGKFPHNLAIADLNVKTDTIRPGEQTSVKFTPNNIGKFTFICTVPGHADKGMTGTLVVQ
jgi:uncharacterized cupredoxin-like copper-binding protein